MTINFLLHTEAQVRGGSWVLLYIQI
jgi:hypothetical protein